MTASSASDDGPATAVRLPAVFRGAARDLWRALPALVIYDLLFMAVGLVVLSPLVAWLFARFVATSGNRAVGNLDLARFLLTPVGLGLSLAIGSLAVAIFLANCAGLTYIGLGAVCDRRVTYFDALLFVVRRFGRILAASFLSLLILAIAALPFIAAALITAWTLLSEHDINFYLDARPPEFWRAVQIGAVVGALAAVVLLVVGVTLVFVLPGVLLSDKPLRQVFLESFALARSNYRRVLLATALWLVAWNVTSLLLNAAIFTLGRWLVTAAGERLAALLVALGSITAVSLLANFALSFVGVASGCLLLARLYRDAIGGRRLDRQSFAPRGPILGARPTWSVPRKALLAVALLAVVISGFVVRGVLESVRFEDRIDITAHRGASLAAPENTLAAVQRAIDAGATFVEIDVQRTADGKLVVSHDADLMRVARDPSVISESTFDALRAIDVGSSFGKEFAGERLPTLDEVIDLTQGHVKLIVELKSYRGDAKALVADVVDTLRRRQMLDEAVTMSLKYDETQQVKRLEPKLEVGFIASAALGDISRLDVDFLAVSKSQATDALVAAAHAQDKQVFVWTVDDRDEMFTMIDRGVDNIITNDPGQLSAVLEERQSLDNAQRILLRFKSIYVQ